MLEIVLRILQVCEESRVLVQENQRELQIMKVTMANSKAGDGDKEDAVCQLIQKPLSDLQELETFNSQLGNRPTYRNVVSKLKLLI
jgi:hypothetical protein